MGRPEKPVNSAGGVVAEFASELRELRVQAGNPTYREMARSALFSSSVLSSAASGNRMPSLPVMLAFVAACGGDKEAWRQRWLATTGGYQTVSARARRPSRSTGGPPCPAQLPQRPRGFVGRMIELSWLYSPGDTPLVISGPAGTGKTDLALYYAYERAAAMTDGQLYADLGANAGAGAPGPDDVLDGFLRALGVTADQLSGTAGHRAGLYRTLLTERRLLVMLDNVADERQVRPLLVESETSTTILVSRRRLLGLRDVRRLSMTSLSRADSVAMITAALSPSVRARADDLDRLAELCGDLPLALDIALRRISLRPHVILRQLLDGWQQSGSTLNWLCIGDLSMRESLRSAYLTLSRPARMLLHWLARIAEDDVRPLPTEDDELADELTDAGLLDHAHHGIGEPILSPLVRAFVLEMAGAVTHDLPLDVGLPRAI